MSGCSVRKGNLTRVGAVWRQDLIVYRATRWPGAVILFRRFLRPGNDRKALQAIVTHHQQIPVRLMPFSSITIINYKTILVSKLSHFKANKSINRKKRHWYTILQEKSSESFHTVLEVIVPSNDIRPTVFSPVFKIYLNFYNIKLKFFSIIARKRIKFCL